MNIGDLHALVRALHHGKMTAEARRSHSRLRQIARTIALDEIHDALRGILALRDAGRIPGWEEDFGLRQALRWHAPDGRQLWDYAVDYTRNAPERCLPAPIPTHEDALGSLWAPISLPKGGSVRGGAPRRISIPPF